MLDPNMEYALEDNMVGEYPTPRCPHMRDLPVEAYADDAFATEAFADIPDTIGECEMAVELITKAKVTKAKKTKELPVAAVVEKTELALKLERFIEVTDQLVPFKKLNDEKEKLRKELSAKADDFAEADQPYTFPAVDNGVVSFTAKSLEREIVDMEKVFDLVGKEVFLKMCTVSLANFDKYVGKAAEDACVESIRKGARKVSVANTGNQEAA